MLRNFAHPDYPAFRFTIYTKEDSDVPEFVDWDDFADQVLVAEPVKTPK